jgi:hypothetical protein
MIENSPDNSREFWRTEELARRLRVSDRWLELLRRRHEGPAFIRLTRKRVVYRREDVEEWLAARRQEPRSVPVLDHA